MNVAAQFAATEIAQALRGGTLETFVVECARQTESVAIGAGSLRPLWEKVRRRPSAAVL
jgi:hypothetical protein